jgi:hypothetical protein
VSTGGRRAFAVRTDGAPVRGSAALAEQRPPGAEASAGGTGAYRHTQFGTVIAAGTALGLSAAVLITLSLSPATLAATRWSVVALYALIAAGFLLFATLTVEVDAREVRVRFGIGLFRKSVPLAEIRRCDVIRTRIWWGWGLHWTPSGWLYNVSGREAVRLELASERPLMIGSDEAQALKRAIEARRPAARTPAGMGR